MPRIRCEETERGTLSPDRHYSPGESSLVSACCERGDECLLLRRRFVFERGSDKHDDQILALLLHMHDVKGRHPSASSPSKARPVGWYSSLPRGCHDAPESAFPRRNAAGAHGTTERARTSRNASTIDASPRRATVSVEARRKGSNPAGVARASSRGY